MTEQATYYRGMPDRRKLAVYAHLIRAAGDPKETKARGGGQRKPGWEKRLGSPEDWIPKLLELAQEPRTFNAMCVMLVGTTADVLFDSVIDKALWLAVEREQLAWTPEAPIHFLDARLVQWE